MVNHQILKGKGWNPMVSHQFPIGKGGKSTGKASGSFSVENILAGNTAAWTQWKHSSYIESKLPLANMMSQATKNLWNQAGWQQSGLDLMEEQLFQWKQVTSYQHDEPSHKEPLKRVWLARVQLGSNGRTALEVKASHFISTAKPQRSSETSLVGNSAAWTQQKHGSCSESR